MKIIGFFFTYFLFSMVIVIVVGLGPSRIHSISCLEIVIIRMFERKKKIPERISQFLCHEKQKKKSMDTMVDLNGSFSLPRLSSSSTRWKKSDRNEQERVR